MSATPQEHHRESRHVSHTESDEETPLLSQISAAGSQRPVPTPASTHQHEKGFYPYAIILLGVFCMIADLGGDLVDAPEIRLLEMAVCRDYYRVHDPSVIGDAPLSYVEEHLCKNNKIQVELAYIRATKSLLMNIPGHTFWYMAPFERPVAAVVFQHNSDAVCISNNTSLAGDASESKYRESNCHRAVPIE